MGPRYHTSAATPAASPPPKPAGPHCHHPTVLHVGGAYGALRLALDPHGRGAPPPHELPGRPGHRHVRPPGGPLPRLPAGRRHADLADLPARPHRLRRFAVPVLLLLRREPLPDRPA